MHIHVILILLSVLLFGCSTQHSGAMSIEQTSEKAQVADEAFLLELQQNQAQLRRLVAMEQDLNVLIAVLSQQSNLKSLPPSLRIAPKVEQHKLANTNPIQPTTQHVGQSGFKLALQPMFSQASAQAQLNRVNAKYPQLSRFLSSSVVETTHNRQTRFMGEFKTVNSKTDAKKLCTIINNIGVLCAVEESR